MILMHFTNSASQKEYVTFVESGAEDFDHATAEQDYARPGFVLRGAWDLETSPLSDGPHTYGAFLGQEGAVYLMDR